VSFTLNTSDFSYWDATAHNWMVSQETFHPMLDSSSRNLPLLVNYQVTTPLYNSPAQGFDNADTSDNSNPSVSNLDGSGYSYSAQSLAAGGLMPGAVVTHDGISFTWPDASSGQPDNIATVGQTIRYSCAGDAPGFLGASTFGTQSGTGTITYSDGSTRSFTLTFADWYALGMQPGMLLARGEGKRGAACGRCVSGSWWGGPCSLLLSRAFPPLARRHANAPVFGDELLATTASWNQPPGGIGNHQVSIYSTSVSLNPGKAIQSSTLPNNKLHIFAIGLDSLQQAYDNVGISDKGNPAGNLDGHGYSYSTQALTATGLMPGSVASHNGILLAWPSFLAKSADVRKNLFRK